MANSYAGRLGYTLAWRPLSDNLSKLHAQEHAARFGSRYWHHRYLRIHRLAHNTAHLRLQTQRYAHWTHPNQHISWSWTSLSLHPSIAKEQHRSAAGADLFWLHTMRHIAQPTTVQVVHMVCSYQDWGCAHPVKVGSCESGLRYYAVNPSNPNARGVFQILGGSLNGGENIHVAHRMWQERGWEPWTASESCWG
jgi:hypothetical protein